MKRGIFDPKCGSEKVFLKIVSIALSLGKDGQWILFLKRGVFDPKRGFRKRFWGIVSKLCGAYKSVLKTNEDLRAKALSVL